jgi:two-component sensor histidine kinase
MSSVAFKLGMFKQLTKQRILIYRIFFIAILITFFSVKISAQNKVITILSQQSNNLLNKLKTFRRNISDSALPYANYVIDIAQKNGDRQLESEAYFELGKIYFNTNNQIKSLDVIKHAESISSSSFSCYYETPQYIGFLLNRQGKADEALTYLFKALKRADSAGLQVTVIDCNFSIADAYRENKSSARAMGYALKGLETAIALKDTSRIINGYSTLSNILSNRDYNNQKRLDSAVYFQEKIMSPAIMSRWIKPYDSAKYFSNMGRLYRMQGKFDIAKKALSIALDVAERRQLKSLKQSTLNELATIELDMGNQQKALIISNSARSVLPASQTSLNRIKELNERAHEANSDIGNYKEAYENLLRVNQINDSLFNIQNQLAIAEIEKKYIRDKKVLEANNLTQKKENERNIIIALAIFIISITSAVYVWRVYKRRQQNSFLTTLIHEVNHRTKNNLQMLNALMAGIYQNVNDDSVKAEIKKLRSYIKSFGLVYDNLIKSASFDDVDISTYTKDISTAVIGNMNSDELELIYKADSKILIDTDKAILIGIIINELITNSLKHAFSSNSKNQIAIQLVKQDDKRLGIIYEDNGIGKIKNSSENKSFGTGMIEQLIKQLRGSIVYDSTNEKRVTMSIPLI